MSKVGRGNVLGFGLRQRTTPGSLLGRMNATFRFLLTGALAIGAAISGVLGELVGIQAALWVGGPFCRSSSRRSGCAGPCRTRSRSRPASSGLRGRRGHKGADYARVNSTSYS